MADLNDKSAVAKSSASSGALGVGSKLPPFELRDQDGRSVTSEQLRGASFVLYFYPKDDTPGCTKEACGFNDALAEFAALGTQIFGVSPDSTKSHGGFRDKYGLRFTLLSDPDKSLATAFGVYQLKKNYGREYMGIVRSTFLVDAEGTITQAWRDVRVAGHVPAVLDAVRAG